MSFLGRTGLSAWAAILVVAAAGCSPYEPSPQDEEKEPHFVLANSRFNSMDYLGAITAFKESLALNPRSAQAHYRLAQLFDTKQPDPAAAIYHYQEYLELNPGADNAMIIRERIANCKQQLATNVMSMPSTPATMKQIEDLTEKNRLLQRQVDDLTKSVKDWSAYAAGLQAARTNPAPQNNFSGNSGTSQTPDDMTSQAATPQTKAAPPKPAKPRTHIVVAGETLAGIARKHSVSLAALEAANPGVSPKKLRAGQPLNLP
jgi:LysM repeat protein